MRFFWPEFSPTGDDLADFPSDTKISIQPCFSFSTSNTIKKLVETKLGDEAQWQSWETSVQELQDSPSGGAVFLACPVDARAKTTHNQQDLPYVPFRRNRFRMVLEKLHVHKMFIKQIQRPKSVFYPISTKKDGEGCISMILCVDGRHNRHSALSLTYFPKSQKTFCLLLGYSPGDLTKLKSKLSSCDGTSLLSQPFLYLTLLLELEEERRTEEVDELITVNSLALLRSADPSSLVGLHRRLTNLKGLLVTWKAQLADLEGTVAKLPTVTVPDDKGQFAEDPKGYIKRLAAAYEEKIGMCASVLEAIQLNLQIELSQIARSDQKVTIEDGKQMKSIAVLTMLFLPGTLIAGFMDAPVYDWEGKGYMYWVITCPLTFLVLATYTFAIGWWGPKNWGRRTTKGQMIPLQNV